MSMNRMLRGWGIWAAFLSSLLFSSIASYSAIAALLGWPVQHSEQTTYQRSDIIPFLVVAISAGIGAATMAVEVFYDFMAFLARLREIWEE